MDVERIEGIVAHVNALRPDAVLLLGDYVAGHKMARYSEPVAHKDWAGALGRLRAPLGVHAVLGNHDWWEDDAVQRRRSGPTKAGLALQDAGITLHENTCQRLVKDGHPFWIAGLGDQWAYWPSSWKGFGVYQGVDDLAGTLARITDDAPVVLMAHEPDIFPLVPDRVALTIAGHTHGGQVRLLGYAPDRSLEVRHALRLRPRRRAGPQPHRLGRLRLQRSAGAVRLAARNRVDRARRPRSRCVTMPLRLVLLAP